MVDQEEEIGFDISDDDLEDEPVEQPDEGDEDEPDPDAPDEDDEEGEDEPEQDDEDDDEPLTEAQQRKLDKIMAKKTAKHYKTMETIAAENEQLKARLSQVAPDDQPKRPEVPPEPDPYDDGYQEKLADWKEAVGKAARWDAEQEIIKEFQQAQQAAQQQQARARLEETTKTYVNRAKRLGVKQSELKAAGSTVSAAGMTQDLAGYILEHDKGPLITAYLGKHPDMVEDLAEMSPMRAAAHLEGVVLPAAIKSRKPPEPTPEPTRRRKGTGLPKQEDPALEGATFE